MFVGVSCREIGVRVTANCGEAASARARLRSGGQGSVLKHSRVPDGDSHRVRGVLDRHPLNEAQLENGAVSLGDGVEDGASPTGDPGVERLVDVRDGRSLVAMDHPHLERLAPVPREHRSGRGLEVRPHFSSGRGGPERSQHGEEDLTRQVLCIRPVANAGMQPSVQPSDVVPVHVVPAAVGESIGVRG